MLSIVQSEYYTKFISIESQNLYYKLVLSVHGDGAYNTDTPTAVLGIPGLHSTEHSTM